MLLVRLNQVRGDLGILWYHQTEACRENHRSWQHFENRAALCVLVSEASTPERSGGATTNLKMRSRVSLNAT